MLAWRPGTGAIDWEVEVAREHYPGSDTDGNTAVWQVGAEAAREWGRFDGAVLVQHQPDGFAGTGANTYVAAEAGWRARPNLRLVTVLGRREQEGSVSYSALNAGVILDVSDRALLDVR